MVVRREDPGEAPEEAIVQFSFHMTEADQENLRWYLEDYLQYPLDPEPKRAARVEDRLAELGRQLFRAVFESEEARDLWAVLRPQLHQTRIEVAVEEVRQAAAVPWELLRDPRTDVPLALARRRLCAPPRQPGPAAAFAPP